jgi:hypothetical protein
MPLPRIARTLLIAGIALPATAGADGPSLSAVGELRPSYVYIDDVKHDEVIQGGEVKDFWTLGAGGSLDAAFEPLHVQADLGGRATLDEESADDTEEGAYGGGLHLNLRDTELGSLGVFGAVGKIRINDVGKDDPEGVVWGVGGEAQAYLDWLTIYLQGGFLDREPPSSGGAVNALKNAPFGRGVVRAFCGENLALEAEGSYAEGLMDLDDDDVWIAGWGAAAEVRLPGTPVSAFVRYTGAHFRQSDDKDRLEVHRVGFGLRVYFGQPSLAAHNLHGATLDLPPYLEWNGIAAGTLE